MPSDPTNSAPGASTQESIVHDGHDGSIREPTEAAALKAIEKAEGVGMSVVRSEPNTILLDLDGYEAKARYAYMLKALK